MAVTAHAKASARLVALTVGVGLAMAWPSPARPGDAGEPPASPAAARRPPRHVGGSLEARVATLSKALALDARQQAELRTALEDQREQLLRIWSDSSLDAATRVSRARSVGDRTADRVRALLTEEQRKRYGPGTPPRTATPGSTAASVETWMPPAAPSTPAAPRVSPYAVAARRQELAPPALGAAHAPAVPPTMRRTRQPIGQQARGSTVEAGFEP